MDQPISQPMRLVFLSTFLACAATTLFAADKSAAGAPKAPAAQKAAPAAGAAAGGTATPSGPHVPKVYLVGDSIVAQDDPRTGAHGWGEFFQIPGNTYCEVVNRAAMTRSAKSFQMEGLWTKVLAEKPDIVLIEFGHNDANLGKATGPKALQEFRLALGRYIHGSRKAGATPVLVTPAHIMAFDKGELVPWIEDFAETMRTVAATEQVPLVDLHARTAELFRALGPEKTDQLHNPGDPIHFNELGAKAAAEMVRREIAKADLKLAWRIFGTNTPLPPGIDPPTRADLMPGAAPAAGKPPAAKGAPGAKPAKVK